MKKNDVIYTFHRSPYDVFHFKCEDEPFDKKDCLTIEDFSEYINEPFEVYEKYIRAIEVEKRICYISVETLTEEHPEPVPDSLFGHIFNDTVFKNFVGEYNDEMKQKVEDYIDEMGYRNKRRQENYLAHTPGFRYTPYMCSIFDTEQTLGFYFSRQGYLSGCFTEPFPQEIRGLNVKGNIKDFEEIGKHFNTDYIKYLYGSKGLAHIKDHYQKHFIDNFEYGKSILLIEQL